MPAGAGDLQVKALIVDDEAPARARLAQALEHETRVEVVGFAENGAQAVEAIESLHPDLVFLDVQMPELTGFDVLRLIDEHDRPAVVFVTAYDEYAVKAFDAAAVDYLLKPFSDQRLRQAIDRVLANVGAPSTIPDPVRYVERLPVRFLKRVRLLDVGDITHLVSEHRVINVYTRAGERFWTPETLDSLERRLDPDRFFRIHRSSLLNLDASIEIEPFEDGRLRVHLPNDVALTVARGPAKKLKAQLGI